MDNIQKKIIKVSEVTAINSKKTKDIIGCKISDGESKYTLWFKKQDGEMTKAYSQWSANKHSIGSEIGIAYKEEPNEYEFTDEKRS